MALRNGARVLRYSGSKGMAGPFAKMQNRIVRLLLREKARGRVLHQVPEVPEYNRLVRPLPR